MREKVRKKSFWLGCFWQVTSVTWDSIVYFCKHFPRSRAFSLRRAIITYTRRHRAKVAALLLALVPCIHWCTSFHKMAQSFNILTFSKVGQSLIYIHFHGLIQECMGKHVPESWWWVTCFYKACSKKIETGNNKK